MERIEVESSSIEWVAYAAEAQELEIRFCGGGIYAYLGVEAATHAALMAAASKGRFVNASIKGRHAYRRVRP